MNAEERTCGECLYWDVVIENLCFSDGATEKAGTCSTSWGADPRDEACSAFESKEE